MASFTGSDDLRGAEFTGVDLHGARFSECDLADVVMRGVLLNGADIDDPFLCGGGDSGGGNSLRVNGVDVVPFVEAELNRRFPGRADRRAQDPDGLRAAWAAVERAWQATLARVAAMPAGTADVQADGEWSFAQTLRHLVMATDLWFGQAILQIEQPFHPIGIRYDSAGEGMPPYAEVLDVRAGRVAMVRGFLATVTPDVLAAPRENPQGSGRPETVRSCLRVILNEEWEHLRYAVRDLDAVEAERATRQD